MSRYNDDYGQTGHNNGAYAPQVDYHQPASLYPPSQPYGSNDYGASTEQLQNKYTEQSQFDENPAYPTKKKSHAMRWIIALVVLVLLGAGGGIAAWRVMAARNNSSNATSSGSTGNGPPGTTSPSSYSFLAGSAKVVKQDPKDPSQFTLDPRLHRSFWGMGYSASGVQETFSASGVRDPNGCTGVQANVTEDIQLISQLTTRLRTYGAACNQSAMLMQAIQDTKVNMTVWLGVYIGNDAKINQEQMQTTLNVISTYGTKHISGVIVGNEYILGSTQQRVATTFIVTQMATFRNALKQLNLPIQMPVGTADAGSVITLPLAQGADFIMANVHPFFGGLPIAQAAAWTNSYWQENNVAVANAAANKPKSYIAETGWPAASLNVANATIGGAVAGVPQLQTFLDTFVCAANNNGTGYFYFQAFDQPWAAIFGGVEPFWGLFDANKILRSITLPTCVSP